MVRYKTIFTTERGGRHQQAALAAAPAELDVTLLRQPDRETLLPYLAEADYFISERVGWIDAAIIGAAPRLRLIQRLGSLAYDIDTAAAAAAGVAVCYWPVGATIRVAEHVVLQMLALSKKLRPAEVVALAADPIWGPGRRTDEDTFAYNWAHLQQIDGLWGKTVGILGFGEIGAELARRLKGWGCPLLYYRRRRMPAPVEAELGLLYADWDSLIGASDYLVNLLPYFPETDRALNAAVFAAMKPGACLVSCGSGSVIDEPALAEAIAGGKLGGAALDTFEWEPLRADNPLVALARSGSNVLLTPHIAAGDTATAARERPADYTNILNHIYGRPLLYRLV